MYIVVQKRFKFKMDHLYIVEVYLLPLSQLLLRSVRLQISFSLTAHPKFVQPQFFLYIFFVCQIYNNNELAYFMQFMATHRAFIIRRKIKKKHYKKTQFLDSYYFVLNFVVDYWFFLWQTDFSLYPFIRSNITELTYFSDI